MLQKLSNKLVKPVDGASLAAFRILYGLVMAYGILMGYLSGDYSYMHIEPAINYTYDFAPWVKPFSEPIMVGLAFLSVLLCLFIATGFLFKLSAGAFVIIGTYIFLLEHGNYLNHIYFALLLGALLFLTPAHQLWSVDAYIKRLKGKWPVSDYVPKWSVYILRFQMEIMLIYAGLVKLSPEFSEGHFLRIMLNGNIFFSYEYMIMLATYSAIALHLIGAPLLLYKKTRLYVLGIYGVFHVFNHYAFGGIGIFPHLTFAATLIFLSPSWPRNAIAFVKSAAISFYNDKPMPFKQNKNLPELNALSAKAYCFKNKMGVMLSLFLVVWFSIQLLAPIRHFTINDNVHWTRNGYMFSWQMMLVANAVDLEKTKFYVCGNRKDELVSCYYSEPSLYTNEAHWRFMYVFPSMMVSYAQHLEETFKEVYKFENVRVYATLRRSISGRPYQNMWDPDLDLTKVERKMDRYDFILPLAFDRSEQPAFDAYIRKRLKSEHGYWRASPNQKIIETNFDFFQDYPEELMNVDCTIDSELVLRDSNKISETITATQCYK